MDARALWRGAVGHLARDEREQAADYLDRLLSLQPDQVRALDARARLYLDAHHPSDALPLLERAASQAEAGPEVFNNYAVALMRAGKTDRSRQVFDEALARWGAHAGILENRASVLLVLGELDAAVADLSAVVVLAPRRAEVWRRKAIAHFRLGQFRAAHHALLVAARQQWASRGSKRRALGYATIGAFFGLLIRAGLGERGELQPGPEERAGEQPTCDPGRADPG